MRNNRIEKIKDILVNYSLGNFDYQIDISGRRDSIDTIISGINMLGEELKTTTISKNYFNNIFNSVSDMIFILSGSGAIIDINPAVTAKLDFKKEELIHKHIDEIVSIHDYSLYEELKLKADDTELIDLEAVIYTKEKSSIPVLCNFSHLQGMGDNNDVGYTLIFKDMSKQKETENLIIRTIVDTQENERNRVAKDLHDSLGQQLSAIKFYLGAMVSAKNIKQERMDEILTKSNTSLLDVIDELRNICFNLMPQTLENYDLEYSVKELCNKVSMKGVIGFVLKIQDLPPIEKSLKIAIFRIVQEFINNSLKHANASKIEITMKAESKNLHIVLKDNGKGFDISEKSTGMGLGNVHSRVKSYNGKVHFISKIGKGTKFDITIPVYNTKLIQ